MVLAELLVASLALTEAMTMAVTMEVVIASVTVVALGVTTLPRLLMLVWMRMFDYVHVLMRMLPTAATFVVCPTTLLFCRAATLLLVPTAGVRPTPIPPRLRLVIVTAISVLIPMVMRIRPYGCIHHLISHHCCSLLLCDACTGSHERRRCN